MPVLTTMFIVCPNTMADFFDKNSKNIDYTKTFFHSLAEKRNETKVNDAKEFIGCIPSQIHNKFINEVVIPELDELEKSGCTNGEKEKRIDYLKTVLSAVPFECENIEMKDFNESIFELSRVLNDEYNVIIVSNYPERLEAVREKMIANNPSNGYEKFNIIPTKTAMTIIELLKEKTS